MVQRVLQKPEVSTCFKTLPAFLAGRFDVLARPVVQTMGSLKAERREGPEEKVGAVR